MSHTQGAQGGRSVLRAISEIDGDSVFTPSQNSLNVFVFKWDSRKQLK